MNQFDKMNFNNVSQKPKEVPTPELTNKDNKEDLIKIKEDFYKINTKLETLKAKNKNFSLSLEEQKKLDNLLLERKNIAKEFLSNITSEELKDVGFINGINGDANIRTVALNKLFDLKLPVAGKDLSTYEVRSEKFLVVSGEDAKAENEKNNLIRSQVEFFDLIKTANEKLKGLSKEEKIKLLKDSELERVVLSGFSELENPITDLYTKIVQGYDKSLSPVSFDDKMYPKSISGYNKNFTPKEMRSFMTQNAQMSLDILLVYKKAEEKGLLK